MKVDVFDSENDKYIKIESIGKIKYIGDSFGVDSLTDQNIYDCVGIEGEYIRVVDDSGEDYLYPINNPRPVDGSSKGGCWKVVKDEKGILKILMDETKKFKIIISDKNE